jgi:hypothetical protein
MKGVTGFKLNKQLLHFRKTAFYSLFELVPHFPQIKIVFLIQQFVHLDQEKKAFYLNLLKVTLLVKKIFYPVLIPVQQIMDAVDLLQGKGPVNQDMEIINK